MLYGKAEPKHHWIFFPFFSLFLMLIWDDRCTRATNKLAIAAMMTTTTNVAVSLQSDAMQLGGIIDVWEMKKGREERRYMLFFWSGEQKRERERERESFCVCYRGNIFKKVRLLGTCGGRRGREWWYATWTECVNRVARPAKYYRLRTMLGEKYSKVL